MVSSSLVANYIIGKSKTPLTPMQVNKLAYISHGFTLALKGSPLFSDSVEAWKYGPIIPAIYHELKHYGGGVITSFPSCGTILHTDKAKQRLKTLAGLLPEVNIINEILDKYGHFSGESLSTITHEEGTPWHQRYKKNKLGVEIPNSLTKQYYMTQLVVVK